MNNEELIAKIKAEIERRITDNTFGAKLELIDILAWLDTLESETTYDTQQYTPRPSVSIEDVARVQFASHAKVFDKKRKAVFDWEQFKEVAGIFYGFGKKDHSDTLESKRPMNPEAAMKELDEKIALVKQRGTWDGVDVDKYMDEVRGREPEKPCHTVEEWMEHIKNADALTKAIFSKGPYNVLYDALNRPYRDCYDAVKEFGELCYQTARQEMMKEAVEGEVHPEDCEIWVNLVGYGYDFKDGDKVKLIIVKEG